jgi:glycosyltransferase involved in cell wall biosynthesis
MPNVHSPRLRILIDPIYVQSANLTSSSTYHKYVSLVRELTSRGHYVYWCIPDAEYVPSEIENHPQVGIIRTSYAQDQFVVDGLITDEFFNLFNRIAGKYHIDVLCTSRNSLALYYKRLLESPRYFDSDDEYTDKSYALPVVLIEEFPQTRKRQHSSRAYFLSQCLGYIASDRTIFLSDHNREEIVEEMREYITTSQITKWLEKVRIIPAGVETAELDKVYSEDRWSVEKGFQVISIGRIFGPTYVEFLPWFDYLFKAGMDDVSLTLSMSGKLSGPMKAKLSKIGFDFKNVGRQFKIYENNPRQNFLRMLRKYHCFIAPVSHLDHPTGIFEAMYMGVPGILPISDYQQTFFKDYPFVINPKKPEELITTLKYIRDNKKKAREMVRPWRDKIRQMYDAPSNIKLLSDEIELAARNVINKFSTSKGVVDIVKELKGKKYEWDDVVEYLRKSGWMGVSIGNMKVRTTFTYARSAIHHAMRLAGYVDTCENSKEFFVRRDIFEQEYQLNKGNSDGTKEVKKTGIKKRTGNSRKNP